MSKSITIFVPTYNRWPILIENLKLLVEIKEKSKFHGVEILVVDNNSYPSTQIRQISIDFPNIKFLQNRSNLGAHFSIAKSLSDITTEYVLVLGDDDFLESDSFLEVLEQLEKSSCDILLFSETSNTKEVYIVNNIDKYMMDHPSPNEFIFISTTIYRTSFLQSKMEALGHGISVGIPLTFLSCAHNQKVLKYDASPFIKRHVNSDENNEWHPIEVFIDSIFDYIWNFRVTTSFNDRIVIAQNIRKNWLNDRILIWSILRSTERTNLSRSFLIRRILGLLINIDRPAKFWAITVPIVIGVVMFRRQLNALRLIYRNKGKLE